MELTKKVKRVIQEKGADYAHDKNLVEAARVYERLKEKGLVRQPSYDIPPLDTIGKHLVQSSAKRKRV